MDANSVQQRLSQITTAWTLVARAHGGSAGLEIASQAALVERYQAAVYRYLLAAVRDLDVADELFQEFALRLVRGDFGRADPKRGRFRDYVKSALINLVINHQKKQKRAPVLDAAQNEPAAPPAGDFDSDQEFLANWRKSLLDRAWDALAAAQEPGGPPFHTVLRFRGEHPEWSGAELVARVNERINPTPPFTDAGLRKILQRARDKFTDLLVEEVARSLQTTSNDAIEQELIDLGFQAYCRRALERRRGTTTPREPIR
jgi:RNA polymerase sigma-70 factor (ECF subfamily)